MPIRPDRPRAPDACPPLGASLSEQGVSLRIWAPEAPSAVAAIQTPGAPLATDRPMQRVGDGTWLLELPGLGAGLRYGFSVDGRGPYPDPYSVSQPEGVHALSEVVELAGYHWHDAGWRGLSAAGLVLYEVHVGAATEEGTLDALAERLPHLRDLGINAVELMPVAEASGDRNWGYDGVDLFAVSSSYGGPRALQRFVDAAHRHGLGVILDVVYNHLGPEGNYLPVFSPYYFTERHHTPWGPALNYDGYASEWVRRLVRDNALHWLHNFHVDGFRLDAANEILDDSPCHLLAELSDTVRAAAPSGRTVVLTAETDQNDRRFLLPTDRGGFGFDAVWADDFHHVVRRLLAGDREGYYAEYAATMSELARVVERGWLFEGQPRPSSGERRGTPTDGLPASGFIWCLDNHDQVGNRPFGDRLHHSVDEDCFRAASALLLLLPYTPLLFMGQEVAASAPFQYFTDHSGDLGRLVTEGRRSEFGGFRAFADPNMRAHIPDPQHAGTFERSTVRWSDADTPLGERTCGLYRSLLRLRRELPELRAQDRSAVRARAISEDRLVVTWDEAGRIALALHFNVGPAREVDAALDADVAGSNWQVVLDTSLDPPDQARDFEGRLPAASALLLRPR